MHMTQLCPYLAKSHHTVYLDFLFLVVAIAYIASVFTYPCGPRPFVTHLIVFAVSTIAPYVFTSEWLI